LNVGVEVDRRDFVVLNAGQVLRECQIMSPPGLTP